jgi:hypothetical protein
VVARVLGDDLAQVDRLGAHDHAPALEAGEREQVVDEGEQPARVRVDDAEELLLLLALDRALGQDGQVAQDGGERRPQLVRDARDEVALQLIRDPQRLHLQREAPVQLLELGKEVGALDRDRRLVREEGEDRRRAVAQARRVGGPGDHEDADREPVPDDRLPQRRSVAERAAELPLGPCRRGGEVGRVGRLLRREDARRDRVGVVEARRRQGAGGTRLGRRDEAAVAVRLEEQRDRAVRDRPRGAADLRPGDGGVGGVRERVADLGHRRDVRRDAGELLLGALAAGHVAERDGDPVAERRDLLVEPADGAVVA